MDEIVKDRSGIYVMQPPAIAGCPVEQLAEQLVIEQFARVGAIPPRLHARKAAVLQPALAILSGCLRATDAEAFLQAVYDQVDQEFGPVRQTCATELGLVDLEWTTIDQLELALRQRGSLLVGGELGPGLYEGEASIKTFDGVNALAFSPAQRKFQTDGLINLTGVNRQKKVVFYQADGQRYVMSYNRLMIGMSNTWARPGLRALKDDSEGIVLFPPQGAEQPLREPIHAMQLVWPVDDLALQFHDENIIELYTAFLNEAKRTDKAIDWPRLAQMKLRANNRRLGRPEELRKVYTGLALGRALVDSERLILDRYVLNHGLAEATWSPDKGFDALVQSIRRHGFHLVGGNFEEAAFHLHEPHRTTLLNGYQICTFPKPEPIFKEVIIDFVVVVGAANRKIYYIRPIDPSSQEQPFNRRIYTITWSRFACNTRRFVPSLWGTQTDADLGQFPYAVHSGSP